ncbi:Sigma 54 modulation protein/ribosomal protein S30EA [Desulfosarcina cetonica]|uniref:ribosome hibernation-promoting factor, HPF/YfiA family n=1 Tax=Desulfosarcina cetonica TaxID=90730 RepID=UPI0006D2136B|nr:ribosome-associated translation inhibitor RaiA [Desulfosarcina cetonica]VTR64470.1 Sigma 54 modulation protein/ribosomal protein S30EA [Desulfosarcina cetonica]
MQLMVTFKNVDSSDYLKSYLEEKLERLDKIMTSPGTADVVFQEEKLRKIVDVNLSGKGVDVHAREESSAWNEAIDLVVDKAKKQLIKSKEKTQSHRAEA